MNDKDTQLLSEAYTQVQEVIEEGTVTSITYTDETSLQPQKISLARNNDNTITVQFGNRFTISKASAEDMARLGNILSTLATAKEFQPKAKAKKPKKQEKGWAEPGRSMQGSRGPGYYPGE